VVPGPTANRRVCRERWRAPLAGAILSPSVSRQSGSITATRDRYFPDRIRSTPGVNGGQACIRDTRITVHGLVEWRKLGLSDSEILDRVEGLTQGDLAAAWGYYADHTVEIDAAIEADAAA
jgi:uncharacterized protein (DUF433 family)